MRRMHWTIGIVVTVVIVVIVLLYLLLPKSDQLRRDAIARANATKNAAVLSQQILQELGYKDMQADLIARAGDVYEFGLVAREGGGIEVIARLNPNAHFTVLWKGQDFLPCEIADPNRIPPGIAEYCLKATLIDRSNIFRVVYTWLFNPYINSSGLIVL